MVVQTLRADLRLGLYVVNIENLAEALGGVFLQTGREVAVDVEGDRDRRVAKTFRHDLRVDTHRQRERRGGVAQVVQPDLREAGSFDGPAEQVADAIRVHRCSVIAHEHVARLDPNVLRVVALSSLTRLVSPNASTVPASSAMTRRDRSVLGPETCGAE